MLDLEKIVLKNILLNEINEAEEGSEELEKDKTPFERDPMNFILSKYVTLNDTLSELMTPSFKEYLNAIFVVAPKPTTFKILLHNGQIFFLTYLGKAYQATIEGKDYYLMTIGEKERCMQAISRILRYGSPLKTKGPEGAEQGTRPEGEEAGGEESEAPAPEATPQGGEASGEELQENKRLLEALLIKEAGISKEEELLKYAIKKLQDSGFSGIKRVKKSDTDPHIRGVFGDEKQTLDAVNKALEGKAKSEVVPAGNRSLGAQSDSFDTYKFTLKSNLENFPKGSVLYVVNQAKAGKSSIAAKSLTPGAFGMNGKVYKTPDQIIETVDSQLTSMSNKELAKAISLLMSDVNNLSGPTIDDVSEIKDYSKSVSLGKKTQSSLSQVLPGDLAIIGKDFGEVLGAIFMTKEINLKKGVKFPKGNEPLVDFYVDGYGISSKYKTGAAATLTKLIEQLDPAQLTTPTQKQLYKDFSEAFKLGVSDSYLQLAKKYARQEVGTLANIMGIPEKNITTQAINDYILNLIGKKIPRDTDPKLDKKIEREFGMFFTVTKSKPSFPIKWGSLGTGKLYGIIMGPLSAALARKLNSKPEYLKTLKEITGKVEIKQLYFDFNLKSNSMSFKLKSFSDPNANFTFTPANISVYNPDNGKMGFKMK